MKRDHTPCKLVPVTLKSLPDGWHADGGNLYLFVRGASRTWVYRYVAPDGKRRNMGLGSLDGVSLAVARKQAETLRAQTKNKVTPIDPLMVKQSERASKRAEQARAMTFRQCAAACMDAMRAGWKNPKHAAQWESTLKTYAYPVFGDVAVADVDTPMVIKCLSPIWTSKNETASRVRGRIEKVLAWATANKYRSGENPAQWRGHLDNLLAQPSKVQTPENHAAMPFRNIAQFMVDLRQRAGLAAKALEFLILTAARTGEVIGATWQEIDREERFWTIPGQRMKAGKEHRIPLSDEALAVLDALPCGEPSDYIFGTPNDAGSKAMSNMAMLSLLQRMGHECLTVHGFRSSFRDWAGETTAYPREVIEHALAHQLKDKAEAAYARGTLFEKRRGLMTAWAVHCASVFPRTGAVVPMRGTA